MDFSWEKIEYRYRQSGDSYLLWLHSLNRYLQLEEPAFQVFRKLADGLDKREINSFCEDQYQLPQAEAERFVSEVKQHIDALFGDHQERENPRLPFDARLPEIDFHSSRSIHIAGKTIRFSFGDKRLEQYVFPHFSHMEIHAESGFEDVHLSCLRQGEKVFLSVNQEEAFEWPAKQVFRLKGEIFMQLIKLIHDQIRGEWMSVIHAASVSRGKEALLFPARSGGGKSTLASLLMAHGCDLLSDDFTPIALHNGGIYSFPASISVKPGSFSLLETYFPTLRDTEMVPSSSKEAAIKYLIPRQPENKINQEHRVRAIVFVQYDQDVACQLNRISNLEALNGLLTESWIADDARVAESFLDWYLDIPCYTLQYGNNQKAVNAMLNLLGHEA